MRHDCCCRTPRPRLPKAILGIGVVLVALVLFLEQIPGFQGAPILALAHRLWPLILVAMGLAHLASRRLAPGLILAAVGAALLVKTLGHGRWDALVWPTLLLCAGLLILLRSLRPRPHRFHDIPMTEGDEDFLRGSATLGGFRRSVRTQAFRGGELSATFGGIELDLTEAEMAGDSAQLDLNLVCGGCEIRIPAHWEVEFKAQAIAGGLDEKGSLRPAERRRRLVITGSVMFGGVVVKRP